jgi:hypothetical protein
MRTIGNSRVIWISSALVCLAAVHAHAELITNGGFEAGFSGWNRINQVGSEGQVFLQSGVLSPASGFTVPAPPQGVFAAMTDAPGPGSHVLYQDFVVPSIVPGGVVSFALFINNGNGASTFFNPSNLDFATPVLNQQVRVDILTTSAGAFSVAPADVLQNLYQTNPGAPLVSGYNTIQVNVSALLQANAGQTLRLRFAEVDNVAPFNLGVDSVSINESASGVPEPGSVVLVVVGLVGLGVVKRRCVYFE